VFCVTAGFISLKTLMLVAVVVCQGAVFVSLARIKQIWEVI
jgi:hypothetical protein